MAHSQGSLDGGLALKHPVNKGRHAPPRLYLFYYLSSPVHSHLRLPHYLVSLANFLSNCATASWLLIHASDSEPSTTG